MNIIRNLLLHEGVAMNMAGNILFHVHASQHPGTFTSLLKQQTVKLNVDCSLPSHHHNSYITVG